MKSDIEIAQEAAMIPVKEVAARYGIKEDDLELYGKYKAKLTDELWNQIKDRPDGKLVSIQARWFMAAPLQISHTAATV